MTEQITLRLLSEKKMSFLLELLRELEFVEVIEMRHAPGSTKGESDFFDLAGLWADRDLSVEALREKAWPQQQ